MSALGLKKRWSTTTMTVDVEVDEELLEENGWHHEDDCKADDDPDFAQDRRELSDWHDKAHGLLHWTMCAYAPCNLLSLDYRSTP